MAVALDFEPLEAGMLTESPTRPVEPPRADPNAPRLDCSVGFMAYNEEANIANAINAVLEQELVSTEITELIVVASGCTDRTAEIVMSFAEVDPRVRLVIEERRAGKASAINLFIEVARSPILVLVNADTVVRPGAIDALVEHFRDPTVGMVGGHPIPINDEDSFLGYAVHLLWRLHDQIARTEPKLGEIVAFRDTVPAISTDSAVDELSIQALVNELGYRLVYEPRAIVYNRGPTTISDFLRQRRRICAGHLWLAKQEGYAASTMSVRRIGRALVESDSLNGPSALFKTAGAVGLEADRSRPRLLRLRPQSPASHLGHGDQHEGRYREGCGRPSRTDGARLPPR